MHYSVEYILRKLKERQFRQLKFKHAVLNGSEAQNAESPTPVSFVLSKCSFTKIEINTVLSIREAASLDCRTTI